MREYDETIMSLKASIQDKEFTIQELEKTIPFKEKNNFYIKYNNVSFNLFYYNKIYLINIFSRLLLLENKWLKCQRKKKY